MPVTDFFDFLVNDCNITKLRTYICRILPLGKWSSILESVTSRMAVNLEFY